MSDELYDDVELVEALNLQDAEREAALAQFSPASRMASLRRRITDSVEIDRQAQEEIDRVLAWRNKRLRSLRGEIAWIESGLIAEARMLALESGGKHKKLDTPNGYVQLKANAERLEVEDEATATAWLLEHGWTAYVKQTQSLRLADLLKSLKAQEIEEPVPGVALVPGAETVTVHPAVTPNVWDAWKKLSKEKLPQPGEEVAGDATDDE